MSNTTNQPEMDEFELAAFAATINRAKSAPPPTSGRAVSPSSLFAMSSGFGPIFGDIRLTENYELFAQSYRNPSQLPPPLQFSLFRGGSSASMGSVSPGRQSVDSSQQQRMLAEIWSSPADHLEHRQHTPGHPPAAVIPVDSPLSWKPAAGPSTHLDALEAQMSGLAVVGQPGTLGLPRMSPHKTPSPQPPQGSPHSARPPCRYFMQGHCTRGASCPFSHVDPSQSQLPPMSPMSAQSATPSLQMGSIASPQAPQLGVPYQPQRGEYVAYTNAGPMGPQAGTPGTGAAGGYGSPHAPGRGGRKAEFHHHHPKFGGPRFTVDPKIATLDQAIGRVMQLSRDQWGCRFLQAKLDEHPEAVGLILDELLDYFAELMVDPFGNYLCQKVMEKATPEQRCRILSKVMNSLVSICFNMHGTRAVQKLIECCATSDEAELIRAALQGSVVPLIMDLNGNHVIQRCLHHLTPQHNQFIFDAVADELVAVATHRHGCCVLQRCIDYANMQQKVQLLQVVAYHTRALVRDPFGNYVVQYALDQNIPIASAGIMQALYGLVAELSTQMFSSHVVEKCVRIAPPDIRAHLVRELADPRSIGMLLQDAFGNYVVQTALTSSEAEPETYTVLAESIYPHLPVIRNTPQGKRIASRLERM